MVKRNILICAICLGCLNCRQASRPAESGVELADTTNHQAGSSEGKSPGTDFNGFYRSEDNQKIFYDCAHPGSKLWVSDQTGKLDTLYQKILTSGKLFPEDYGFAEVRGSISLASSDVKAQGFDSILNVQQVLAVQPNDYKNACIPYGFWGSGKDPDWSVQVSKNENVIRLHLSSHSNTLLFPYLPPEMTTDSTYTFRTENVATGQSLLLIFKKQNCGTTSSLRYSVRIIYSGLKLQGCAIQGPSL